eukprot:12408835-Karenia_brevis.AAC.1
MADWAASQDLRIMNTFFRKQFAHAWTHEQHGRKRTIDYFLIDGKFAKYVHDVKGARGRKRKQTAKGWKPKSEL